MKCHSCTCPEIKHPSPFIAKVVRDRGSCVLVVEKNCPFPFHVLFPRVLSFRSTVPFSHCDTNDVASFFAGCLIKGSLRCSKDTLHIPSPVESLEGVLVLTRGHGTTGVAALTTFTLSSREPPQRFVFVCFVCWSVLQTNQCVVLNASFSRFRRFLFFFCNTNHSSMHPGP